MPGGVTAREARSGWSSPRPVELTLDCGTCTGSARVTAGDTLRFALHRSTLEETPARVWSDTELAEAMDETVAAWRSWSALHQTYEGPSRDLVHTSGRVLQALKFQPSGAIVAAATTSLPEGVGGEQDLSERTLSHLSGWRNSRPVRVGDGAWDQQQVDVYGELLGAAHRLVDHLHDLDPQTRSSLGAVADAAAARWKEKGPGHLGGPGGAPALPTQQGHVLVRPGSSHRLVEPHRRQRPRGGVGTPTRRDLRNRRPDGWSDTAQALTQYVSTDAPDASSLMICLVGLLPATHPRVLATIEAIEQRLTDERGPVHRYRTEEGVDGLAGEEGTFLPCTFWLAQALAQANQVDRATTVFQRAANYAKELGLLAEGSTRGAASCSATSPRRSVTWAIDHAKRRGSTP